MLRSFNIYNILHTIGISLIFESLFMLLVIPVVLIYHEPTLFAFVLSFLITGVFGIFVLFLTKKRISTDPSIKESFLIVSLTWIFISIFGTLPFILTKSIPHFINALFETVSGFTTTGSSILTDIEALTKGVLFWRALTHWIGGMGIIVLVLAILPYFKIGGHHLMIAEGSFAGVEKMKPRLIDVAKRLWLIYVMLTVGEVILLCIAGMPLYDSICHSFATIATGGFSTKNASIMEYSPVIQYIITVFMILSGMNFTLHYFALHRKSKAVFRNEEWKAYVFIILIASILITLYVRNSYPTIEASFRHSLFQVSSLLTATGFVSADYEQWPFFTHAILFIIMIIGACVGSTGGGIKVARYVVAFKNVSRMFKRLINPNSIFVVRFNGSLIQNQTVRSISTFIFIYYLTIVIGSLIMASIGLDIRSASSSVITTLGGIGPGFGTVGPVNNFASIPIFGKIYLSFNMILGRLEILSVLAIMNPSFYKV